VDGVAVVALLARGGDAVAASGERAVRVAAVAADEIAVVTGFARVHDAIAAPTEGTVGVAAVVVDVVPVVARLARRLDPVPAGRDRAVAVAPVTVDRVAVVALLGALIDDAVTAGRGHPVLGGVAGDGAGPRLPGQHDALMNAIAEFEAHRHGERGGGSDGVGARDARLVGVRDRELPVRVGGAGERVGSGRTTRDRDGDRPARHGLAIVVQHGGRGRVRGVVRQV